MLILLGAQTQQFERVLSHSSASVRSFNSDAVRCTANRVEIRHQLHDGRCMFHCHSCCSCSTVSLQSTLRESTTQLFGDRLSIFDNNVLSLDFALLFQAVSIIPRLPSLYQWYSGKFLPNKMGRTCNPRELCRPSTLRPKTTATTSKRHEGSFLIVDLQVSANISKQMTSSVDLQQSLRAFQSWLMKSLSSLFREKLSFFPNAL